GKVLPYSDEFDAARKELAKLSGIELTDMEFWQAMQKSLGPKRQPPPRKKAAVKEEAESDLPQANANGISTSRRAIGEIVAPVTLELLNHFAFARQRDVGLLLDQALLKDVDLLLIQRILHRLRVLDAAIVYEEEAFERVAVAGEGEDAQGA